VISCKSGRFEIGTHHIENSADPAEFYDFIYSGLPLSEYIPCSLNRNVYAYLITVLKAVCNRFGRIVHFHRYPINSKIDNAFAEGFTGEMEYSDREITDAGFPFSPLDRNPYLTRDLSCDLMKTEGR
jgi:hypothetical protein